MTAQAIGPGVVLGGRYRLDTPIADLHAPSDAPGGSSAADTPPGFWRGTDAVLHRSVAIHVVPAADPRSVAVLAAARASATITDPHLLRVLDCDQRDGVVWVVNEWAEGATLAMVLRAGPLAPERAARLTREVAEALAAAHAAGVAHGRLTPEAVVLTDAGTVRLVGFAVTAALDGAAVDEPDLDRRGYGVPDPVQADVIDLVALLYAGLTGRWAGIAPSTLPPAPVDARGPLRPRQVRAGVPRMLDTLCERVLRREAHEQELPVETAQEVLAALTDEVGDQATGVLEIEDVDELAAPPSPSGRGWTGARSTGREGDPAGPAHRAVPPPAEPTVALPAVSAVGAHAADDIDATQAAPPPVWADAPGGSDIGSGARVPAAPQPPYEDPPERPLFASTDRRPPDVAPGTSAWLYGDGDTGTLDPVVDGARPRPPGGRSVPWGRIAAALAVALVLAAMIVAFELGRSNHADRSTSKPPSTQGATPTAARIQPQRVSDFDPDGNPSTENPQEVPLATDGNPATGWTTMTYTRPALGGLKPGVGLMVDLGSDRSVGSVQVRLGGSPTDLALYAAPAGTTTAPANVTSMRRVAVEKGAAGQVTLRPPSGTRTRYLVVWLTSLPPVGGGYRGEIDELTIRG